MKQFTLFTTILVCFFFLQACHIGRFFYFNYADVNDYRKFPSDEINTSTTPFSFVMADKPWEPLLPETLKSLEIDHFTDYLEANKTLAFLIIRNDTIRYERYFEGYDKSSVIPSFSVAKSFVSTLIGISIDKKLIQSVEDSITTYLPELRGKGLEKVTLLHLLDMRSGIQFTESYSSPFSVMAKYYYGLHLKKYLMNISLAEEPGTRYNYISINTQLLGWILENVWQMPLAQITEEQLWKPLHMEFDASWSLDSRKSHTAKAFCCLNARARDFAKLGRLYLNHGQWDDHQIVSREWVNESLSIHNDSRDSQRIAYSHHWRVLPKGAFFAKGVLGQYIFADPNTNTIIVRLGRSSNEVNWVGLFGNICKQN